jgi:hypothetical protein
MMRKASTSRRQLTLSLDRAVTHPLPEEVHQALVAALADLLLEALGQDLATEGGERDES